MAGGPITSQVIEDSGPFYPGTLLASAFVFHLRVQMLASDSEPHSYPASREKKRKWCLCWVFLRALPLTFDWPRLSYVVTRTARRLRYLVLSWLTTLLDKKGDCATLTYKEVKKHPKASLNRKWFDDQNFMRKKRSGLLRRSLKRPLH